MCIFFIQVVIVMAKDPNCNKSFIIVWNNEHEPTFYETNKCFKEISQINMSYELFIMDQSSSYIIRTYSYIETTMYLIYKNAFKRCINKCTFHDNLLFYICSVLGPIRFWNFLVVRVFSLSQTQWKIQSIALNFGTTPACVLLCLIILTFLSSLLLKLRSHGHIHKHNERYNQ